MIPSTAAPSHRPVVVGPSTTVRAAQESPAGTRGLRLLAAAALALVAGCSLEVPPPGTLDIAAPPEPLAIAVGAADEAVPTFGPADDDDPLTPGVQLRVRVDVGDEAIDVVALDHLGSESQDVVAEDLDGRRVALFVITLVPADNPLVATGGPARVSRLLRARL